MRLNPYHPPRYWTHLARALFHQQRFEEALDALEHVGKARLDDLAYRVAAWAGLGDADEARANSVALLQQHSDFDPAAFAESLPYDQEVCRQALLEPLASALHNPGGNLNS